MLSRQVCLGEYGKLFGSPYISIEQESNRIRRMDVIRGAPCGATWHAARKMAGLTLQEALTRFGLEVQFFCTADPANWDPIYEKSPVHMAADVHSAALKRFLAAGKGDAESADILSCS